MVVDYGYVDETIKIDSFVEVPKHTFLKEDFLLAKSTYKMILTGTDSSYLLIQLAKDHLDSVKTVFLNTPKDIMWRNYYLSRDYSNSAVYNSNKDSIGVVGILKYVATVNEIGSVVDVSFVK